MKKILIADALRSAIDGNNSFLRRSDVQVFTARTNDSILELHRTENMSLIISQLDMPGLRTEQMCSLIRADQNLRHVSMIMFCVDSRTERDRAARCNANAVLMLPADGGLLIEKAEQLLNISSRESYRVLLSVKIDGTSKDRSFFCKSENISSSGLLLETDRVLATGERVVCSFFLPDSHQIILTGEVVRNIQQKPKTSMNRYGIKFFQVSARDRAAIEAFVGRKTQAAHW